MTRTFYLVLFVAIVAGAVFLLTNKTASPLPTESAERAQAGSVAEFGGVSLRLEYATTTAARELGLGRRESIAPDEGMLFVFPIDEYYGFWMNDMLMPIDIFWLDSQGQVVTISENVPPSSYPDVFYPTAPARYVLETIAGFARAHGVATGTPLILKNFPSVTE